MRVFSHINVMLCLCHCQACENWPDAIIHIDRYWIDFITSLNVRFYCCMESFMENWFIRSQIMACKSVVRFWTSSILGRPNEAVSKNLFGINSFRKISFIIPKLVCQLISRAVIQKRRHSKSAVAVIPFTFRLAQTSTHFSAQNHEWNLLISSSVQPTRVFHCPWFLA